MQVQTDTKRLYYIFGEKKTRMQHLLYFILLYFKETILSNKQSKYDS